MQTRLSNTTQEEFAAHVARLQRFHEEMRAGNAEAKARYKAEQAAITAEQLEKAKAGAERLGVTWADAMHYAAALARWGKAGFPVREQVEVERIEREICRPCEAYRDGRCGKCGCNVTASSIAVTNKIKMMTETCPLGKWPSKKAEPTEGENIQAAVLMAQMLGQDATMDAATKQRAIGLVADILGVKLPGDKPQEKP